MTGPQDPAATRGDRLRAGHADRERVIEALKDAFVQGRLDRDELDARAGQAHRRPLARAAAGAGGCLVIAAVAVRIGSLADPGATPGPIPKVLALPSVLVAFSAVVAAVLILVFGAAAAVDQRRSRRPSPPPAG